MRNYLLLVLVTGSIVISACRSEKEKWNDDISFEIKNEIKSFNDSIIAAIRENNPQKLKLFFSDRLIDQIGKDLDSVVAKMHNTVHSTKYSVLDVYYIKSPKTDSRDTIVNDTKGDKSYKINFDGTGGETYISLLLHDEDDGQLLMTGIFQKQQGQWKLNAFRIGRYSFFGNTAIDIYNKAKEMYDKGDVMDAANIIALAKQPLTPAFQFFQYSKDLEIKEFARKVLTEVDTVFRFPNLIGELKTEPTIYNIRPLPMMEGIFPVITYGTKINLSDTVSVKKENDALQILIGQLFPGIEKNNKFVFFQAYQQTPGGLKPEAHLEFVMHGIVNPL